MTTFTLTLTSHFIVKTELISGLTPVKSALLLKLLKKKMTIKVYTKCLANIYFDVFKENIPVYYKVYSVESAIIVLNILINS